MNLLRSLLLLSAALFCTSAQEPSEDPIQYCHGCFASVTFVLPGSAEQWDLIDGYCITRSIDWTITRHLEIDGHCQFATGSCLPARRCLALGRAVGTMNGQFGPFAAVVLSAGNNTCGGEDQDEAEFGDTVCGYTRASITAKCTECSVSVF